MKKFEKKDLPKLLIFFVIVIIWVSVIGPKISNEEWESEKKGSINILEYSKEVKGKIIRYSTGRGRTGVRVSELSNGIKFMVHAGDSKNYDYDLFTFLQVNDSIYKPANTDSIYIYDNEGMYYFILGKRINQKEEPKKEDPQKEEEPYYRKYFNNK